MSLEMYASAVTTFTRVHVSRDLKYLFDNANSHAEYMWQV